MSEEKTKILVVYYSSYGHTFKMAESVAYGAASVADVEVKVKRVAEFPDAEKAMMAQPAYAAAKETQKDVEVATLDDLKWADGVCWGTPTRFGNMAAQMKQFIDTAGSVWMSGGLEDKPAGVFTSTATIHGGQESTILATTIPLLHLGMVIVGIPYMQNTQIMVTDGVGGTPYGPSTLAGGDGSRQPVESELLTAKNLGIRVAKVAKAMKSMRN